MNANKIPRAEWPVDIAHATEAAVDVWRGMVKRRVFYIFEQLDGGYIVRENTSNGWSVVEGVFGTMGLAKRAAELDR